MLFTPIKLAQVEFKNRIFVSPMCQYSAKDGVPNDWHLVHLGSRAIGGAALVMTEATGVSAVGRISPGCTGIWNEEQAAVFARIVRFIQEQGALAGIQLAHAGRKGSTSVPWDSPQRVLSAAQGGWQAVGPSAVPYKNGDPEPRALSVREISGVVGEFREAALRSLKAGFDVAEIHMAHGYLLHEFLSPLSNLRIDQYGGSLENRMRMPLEVVDAVRAVWPLQKPLFVRISASDWAEGGWDLAQSLILARELQSRGVNLIDCSSGGLTPKQEIDLRPGYQVPFAEAIRKKTGMPVGAVGLITNAKQADEILSAGQADVVFLAREFLRDPYFSLHAARELGVTDVKWPVQYERARN